MNEVRLDGQARAAAEQPASDERDKMAEDVVGGVSRRARGPMIATDDAVGNSRRRAAHRRERPSRRRVARRSRAA